MLMADKIKKLRKALKLSQGRFATKLSVSQAAVCYWELGFQNPGKKRIDKLNELARKNGIKINFGE